MTVSHITVTRYRIFCDVCRQEAYAPGIGWAALAAAERSATSNNWTVAHPEGQSAAHYCPRCREH